VRHAAVDVTEAGGPECLCSENSVVTWESEETVELMTPWYDFWQARRPVANKKPDPAYAIFVSIADMWTN
jgi:hypothetical protein